MPRPVAWNDVEKAVLLSHYAAGGPGACAPLLPRRGRHAIVIEAGKLGLRFERYGRWSDDPDYARHIRPVK